MKDLLIFRLQRALALVVASCLVQLHDASDEASYYARLVSKDIFDQKMCLSAVEKVQKGGIFTEEEIMPICKKELKSGKCDFFAEALSLAISHSDFDAPLFCVHMEEARFCSYTMDRLLMSQPVEDLAFGDCLRAKSPSKGEDYCRKFQKMFGYAATNGDLDTMRACYMMEAYSNLTTSSKEQPETTTAEPAPAGLNVTTKSENFNSFGDGKATPKQEKQEKNVIGPASIVVGPKPLQSMGSGTGKMDNVAGVNETLPAPPGMNPKAAGATIITEPVPTTAFAAQPVASLAVKKQTNSAQPAQSVKPASSGAAVAQKPAATAAPSKVNLAVSSTAAPAATVSKAQVAPSKARQAPQAAPAKTEPAKKTVQLVKAAPATVTQAASAAKKVEVKPVASAAVQKAPQAVEAKPSTKAAAPQAAVQSKAAVSQSAPAKPAAVAASTAKPQAGLSQAKQKLEKTQTKAAGYDGFLSKFVTMM